MKSTETNYIFVTGGVMSGLGKGVTTSSIARLIQDCGYDVTCLKVDPYVNIDAGTMRPTEHGEVFVTDDGGEIDQDLGNYERFLNKTLSKDNNLTTGKVYKRLIEKERAGHFLGKTVQIIPHLTNEVIEHIEKLGENKEFLVTEIGGTVGDYENTPFLEAARQMRLKLGKDRVAFVHVTYLPILKSVGEQKTKPTQHSVKMLREAGIEPDLIVGRSKNKIDSVRKKKLALFCNVQEDDIFSNPDVENVYRVPSLLKNQGIVKRILKQFNKEKKEDRFEEWEKTIEKMKKYEKEVKIGVIGKYISTGDFSLTDSYISIKEAINHASAHLEVTPRIKWIDSTDEDTIDEEIDKVDCVIVPGGFGTTGINGKIKAIKKCREEEIPFLGLCLGMQLAVVEHAQNLLNLEKANSTEINESNPHPVVCLLPGQIKLRKKGATMRLGSYPAVLKDSTRVKEIYGKKEVEERHRHRLEVNPSYHEILESKGLIFSGRSPNGKLIEFVERENHPYFIATQAHPEFKSRPEEPHPLFVELIKTKRLGQKVN